MLIQLQEDVWFDPEQVESVYKQSYAGENRVATVIHMRSGHRFWIEAEALLNTLSILRQANVIEQPEQQLTLAETIRAHRRKLGLSQGTVAVLLDVTPAAVSQFETGIRLPRIDNVRLLERILDAEGLLIPCWVADSQRRITELAAQPETPDE